MCFPKQNFKNFIATTSVRDELKLKTGSSILSVDKISKFGFAY